MKKLLCILIASMFIISGCGKTEGIQPDADTTEQTDENKVMGATSPGKYTVNDFALYTLDEENYLSKVVAVLGVDPDTVEYSDDKAAEAARSVTMQSGLVKTTNDVGKLSEQNLVNYFSYDGSRIPLANVKGIMTTGLYITDTDKNCSKVDEVIKAYEIDVDNEEYKYNENPDGSYTIDIYFTRSKDDGSVERIIVPKGSSVQNPGYSIRFYISNDYVHCISAQMY